MNQVDFLPESFARGRAQRLRVMRQGLLVAAVAGGLLVWGVALRAQVAGQARDAASLEDQVIAARQMKTEMNRLRDEQKQLAHQVKIQQQLSQPVSHSRIVATLSAVIPAQVAVTELTMTTARPAPAQAVPRGATRSRKRQQTDAAAARQQLNEVAIELQALAPDGALVANLVEDLSDHPLFTDVQIRHTRAVEVRGLMAREFRLQLQVDLDRRYLDPDDADDAQQQEVAHVD